MYRFHPQCTQTESSSTRGRFTSLLPVVAFWHRAICLVLIPGVRVNIGHQRAGRPDRLVPYPQERVTTPPAPDLSDWLAFCVHDTPNLHGEQPIPRTGAQPNPAAQPLGHALEGERPGNDLGR